jgi:hypothetical protein
MESVPGKKFSQIASHCGAMVWTMIAHTDWPFAMFFSSLHRFLARARSNVSDCVSTLDCAGSMRAAVEGRSDASTRAFFVNRGICGHAAWMFWRASCGCSRSTEGSDRKGRGLRPTFSMLPARISMLPATFSIFFSTKTRTLSTKKSVFACDSIFFCAPYACLAEKGDIFCADHSVSDARYVCFHGKEDHSPGKQAYFVPNTFLLLKNKIENFGRDLVSLQQKMVFERTGRVVPSSRTGGQRAQACSSKHPDGYCEALF